MNHLSIVQWRCAAFVAGLGVACLGHGQIRADDLAFLIRKQPPSRFEVKFVGAGDPPNWNFKSVRRFRNYKPTDDLGHLQNFGDDAVYLLESSREFVKLDDAFFQGDFEQAWELLAEERRYSESPREAAARATSVGLQLGYRVARYSLVVSRAANYGRTQWAPAADRATIELEALTSLSFGNHDVREWRFTNLLRERFGAEPELAQRCASQLFTHGRIHLALKAARRGLSNANGQSCAWLERFLGDHGGLGDD